ncbi:MAG: hypothetical protein OXG95_08990 [Chloroflexi bacterium]|nr:hypothetical protein [Chloroflexota bacterium]
MSAADDVLTRYADELRGFGPSLPDDLAGGARALERRLSEEDLDRWAAAGVALARHSLRSWEAAGEYFRVSPRLFPAFSFEELLDWQEVALDLAESSSMIAAAFVRATPEVLQPLQGADTRDLGIMGEWIGRPGEQVRPWAALGKRLAHGNWKSVALAASFFEQSPALLHALPLEAVGELIDVVDRLSDRSYQLAASCLERSGELFADLAPPDRRPFLEFADAVAQASWADTRLYFERGPALIANIDRDERAAFLQLAADVTEKVGRQGYPLFIEAAESLAQVEPTYHETLVDLARRLAVGSPAAAMSFLRSSPTVLTRLTADQLERWLQGGWDLLFEAGNIEGAEAYFRLESQRAEEMLETLSARIELRNVSNTLRLYAKALTGEQIAIRSTEDLVDAGIGWVQESVATTEGSAIYLPPYVSTFNEQRQNFLSYKVYATHQSGRMEFGSFLFDFDAEGAHTASTLIEREETKLSSNGHEAVAVTTPMERYFDLFEDRELISGLFTIVEDARIDAHISREYGGIRPALRELQAHEAANRTNISRMALREAYLENLLRASLKQPQTMRWPRDLMPLMARGIDQLKIVDERGADVQDSAEVAATIYAIVESIPNVAGAYAEIDWDEIDEDMIQFTTEAGGADGPEMPSGEEADFSAPDQPEFRGDFKPEIVQLMMKLKQQSEGEEPMGGQLTQEQLEALLEKSVEIVISDIAEGDIASSMGMFLTNLEREALDAKQGPPGQTPDGADAGDSSSGTGASELPIEVNWSYYDEWDFRAGDYRPRWCRVGERPSEEGELDYYEETLKTHHGLVTETRRQFELLRPEHFRRIKRLEDGEDVDLDQAIEFIVDKRAGVGPLGRVYWRRNKVERDVAVAFLLDMSASTDEEIEKTQSNYQPSDDDFDDDPRKYFQWLTQRRARFTAAPPKRIIDLEKESLVLIVEALEAIGDTYGIYGFSGYGRDNVEFHVIKDLNEMFGDRTRRRIDKITPIRSTRMGPAIRHTVAKLDAYDAKVKLLILVSDGRPQDHGYGRDRTEKEYAVHDTHQALVEAKQVGVTPFLITVDKEGHDYLKEMCDDVGYEVVDNIESLPRRLTSLYRVLATE